MTDWLYNHRHRSLFRHMHPEKAGGAVCQGIRTGGQWSKKEQDLHINQLERLTIKFVIFTFAKMWKMSAYTYSGRQHDSLRLFAENGWDKESRTNADLKGNLGVPTWAGDHNYCRIFTRESQLQGRLGISAPEKFLRMETVSSSFQPNMANIRKDTRNIPVCFKVIKSASKLLLLEAGSQQSWKDALQQKWYHKSLYAFPSFALIHKVLKKVEEEKVPSLIIVISTWQTQSWYQEFLRLSVRNPIIWLLKEDLLRGPQNQQHPLIQN